MIKIVVKIKEKKKNSRCFPKEVGEIIFTAEMMEKIALELYDASKDSKDSKDFEYSAKLDIITL